MTDLQRLWLPRGHVLHITEAGFEESNLRIGGDSWFFRTFSSWRLINQAAVITGNEELTAEMHIKTLIDDVVVDIVGQSSVLQCDPVFILRSGRKLEVFSSNLVESWVLTLPTPPIIVASPTDPSSYVRPIE